MAWKVVRPDAEVVGDLVLVQQRARVSISPRCSSVSSIGLRAMVVTPVLGHGRARIGLVAALGGDLGEAAAVAVEGRGLAR